MECSYLSMFSSTALVCIVDLMCIVDHMCLLACNVCGGITAVAFSCSGILHLTLGGSTSGHAWYPSCPVISGKLPSSGLLHYLLLISVCVGHLSAVFTRSRHCFYSTESIFYFSVACPIYPAKVSHYYRPTSVDTAFVHIVKGITQNIHKRFTPRHLEYPLHLPPLSALNACYRYINPTLILLALLGGTRKVDRVSGKHCTWHVTAPPPQPCPEHHP